MASSTFLKRNNFGTSAYLLCSCIVYYKRLTFNVVKLQIYQEGKNILRFSLMDNGLFLKGNNFETSAYLLCSCVVYHKSLTFNVVKQQIYIESKKFFTVGNYLQVVPILTNFWLIIYLFWSSLQIYKRNVFFALLCIVVLTKEHTESYNTRIETYISETYIQGISGHFICLSRLCFRQQLFPLFRVSNKIFGIVFQKRYIYV